MSTQQPQDWKQKAGLAARCRAEAGRVLTGCLSTMTRHPPPSAVRNAGSGQGNQQRNKSELTPSSRLLKQKAKLFSKKNKQRNGSQKTGREKERSRTHFQKRIFPHVKCTDNLMELTWNWIIPMELTLSGSDFRKSNYKVIITS